MRIKWRPAVVLALAIAGALAAVSIALAAASSTVNFAFTCAGRTTPNKCPATTYTSGRLFVHTHTNYTGSPATSAVKRAQLFYDADFQFYPGATANCDPPGGTSVTMKQAIAACGSSLVGTGRAQALGTDPFTGERFTVNGCVLAFNGTPVNAATGVGSNTTLHPVVWLFIRVQISNPSSIDCSSPATNENGTYAFRLRGILHRKTETSGAHPQFPLGTGAEQDFNNITSVSPAPATDVQVTFVRNTATGGYVRGRCSHSNHVWRLTTKFTYNDGATQTVPSTRTCTVG